MITEFGFQGRLLKKLRLELHSEIASIKILNLHRTHCQIYFYNFTFMRANLTFFKRSLISIVFILNFSAIHAQCDWQAVGPDDDMFFMQDGSTTYQPSIASDNNGTQYVAFSDAQNGKKISVKRYVKDHWTFLGTPGFSQGPADLVKIATDNLNRVYVAYKDSVNYYRLTVQMFNGFNWSVLGIAGMGNDTIRDFDMVVDKSTNHPLVFFTDSTDISTVREFNGSTWNIIGTSNFGSSTMYECHIASNNGTPYVSYCSSTPNQLNILKFNGTSWIAAGTFSSSFTYAGWSSRITFDHNNIPYIAFSDYSASGLTSVMYLNGSTWTYLGTPGIVSHSTWYNNLAFDQSNNAFLAYTISTGTGAEISKYDGTNWSIVSTHMPSSNVFIPNQYAYYRGMSMDPVTNDLYLIYTENTASPLFGWRDFGVMKYDGTTTKMTGSTSVTGAVTSSGSATAYFDIDKFGTPYVAYSDSLNNDRVSVKKYDGTNWVYVGTPGFNTGYTEWAKIAFDTTGVPYVAFRQDNADIHVMKFDGTSWVSVGAAITNTYDVALAINPLTNQPHIFYCDVNNSLLGNVRKFDGSSWVSEGPANFSVGSSAFCNIKFDHLGNEYVAYSDNGIGTLVVVKKFVGSNWVTVGSGTVSTVKAWNTKLAIDAQNQLYVIYSDQTDMYTQRPLCQKFNGTTWQFLGSYFTTGYASDIDIAVDNSGNVFVYYNEQYLNYYPGTVKRFFNNAWIPVGRQYIANSSCKTNQIKINPVSGLPFIGSITQAGVSNSNQSRGFYLKSLPCNFTAALMGQVVYDANSNCVNDAGEQNLCYQSVKLTQGINTNIAFTDNSGHYYFTNAATGNYTIGLGNLTNGYNVQCTSSLPHSTSIIADSLTTEDFSVACTPSFDIIANSFSPIGTWWPGQNVKIWSNVSILKTACNGITTPGKIRLIFPPCLTYIADTTLPLQPDSVSYSLSGDTVWYYIADVYNPSPYLYNSILTSAHICNTATSADTLCVELSVSALNDNNTSNNTYARCMPISASYDPNFKEVTPKGSGSAGYIPSTTVEMLYTIHFQNTGNAPAVNIRVTDTLSQNLDPNTFEIISSSHYMQNNSLTNGVITFNFMNIMLPDSSADMLNSMGFVSYKISLKPGLAPLTKIKNTANIYFDYNAPVRTNTTLNTIDAATEVKNNSFSSDEISLFPNPSNSEITVRATKDISSIRICDLIGNVVYHKQDMKTTEVKVNLLDLSSGIYFVELYTADRLSVIKLVKN